jgi:hypothetical protein
MMTALTRLFNYTTGRSIALYLLSVPVAVSSSLLSNNVDKALGLSAALLMWWPMVRDLVPVSWSVVAHGRWPEAKIVRGNRL